MAHANAYACFSCGERHPDRFVRYLPSFKPVSLASSSTPERPYISEWRRARCFAAEAETGSLCVFCFKDLHDQWLRFESNKIPIADRRYCLRKDAPSRMGDGVCYLCGSVFPLVSMFRLSQTYYPFLARYPVPRGAVPIDSKGHVVTCDMCRTAVYVQWKTFEESGIKEPNRLFLLRIGDVDVRFSVATLPNKIHSWSSRCYSVPMATSTTTPTSTSTCFLCGKVVVLKALRPVKLSYSPSSSDTTGGLLHFPFLNRIPPAKGSSPSNGNFVSTCTDCHATLAELNRIQQVNEPISATTTTTTTTFCYICGSPPASNRLSYLHTSASTTMNPKVPHFPALFAGPRAKGSRAPDARNRVLVCASCRVACYAAFFNYERQGARADAREYVHNFACYVCGSGGALKTMHWIPSTPIESRPDCYPFLTAFQPVRGTAELDALGCALVCTGCYKLLHSQFVTMEKARVPLQYRTYTVNGRAFNSPKDCFAHKGLVSVADSKEVKISPVMSSSKPVTSTGTPSLIQKILNSKQQIAPKPPTPTPSTSPAPVSAEEGRGAISVIINGEGTTSSPIPVLAANGFSSPIQSVSSQQVVLDQKRMFHSRVGKLQLALARSESATATAPLPPSKGAVKIIMGGTVKFINGRGYYCPTPVKTTSVALGEVLRTQRRAKALAKHGNEKLKFFGDLGLQPVEEFEKKGGGKSLVVNYPFVEEKIYVGDEEKKEEENGILSMSRFSSKMDRDQGNLRLAKRRRPQNHSSDEEEFPFQPRSYPTTGSRKRRPRIWEESSDDEEKDKELLSVSNQQASRKESLLVALADQFAGETNDQRADGTKDIRCCCECFKEDDRLRECSVCANAYHFDCDEPALDVAPPGNRLCPSCTENAFQGPARNSFSWPGVLDAMQSFHNVAAERRHEILWRRKEIVRLEREQKEANAEAEKRTSQVMALVDKKKRLVEEGSQVKKVLDRLIDSLDSIRKACTSENATQ